MKQNGDCQFVLFFILMNKESKDDIIVIAPEDE